MRFRNSDHHSQDYIPRRLAHTWAPIGPLTALILLASCGNPPAPQSPTPLAKEALQRLYVAAATSYNTAEAPVLQAESQYCPTASAAANLQRCQTALSADRQATIAFDNAIRGLTPPAPASADVAKLLGDDARLETLLEQAATAPSLSVINALSPQIFALLKTTFTDATSVRRDIGLPPASPVPSATAA